MAAQYYNDSVGVAIASSFIIKSKLPIDARQVIEAQQGMQEIINNGASYEGLIVWDKIMNIFYVFTSETTYEELLNVEVILTATSGTLTTQQVMWLGNKSYSISYLNRVYKLCLIDGYHRYYKYTDPFNGIIYKFDCDLDNETYTHSSYDHAGDTTIHVTSTDKARWNQAVAAEYVDTTAQSETVKLTKVSDITIS